MVQIYKKFSKQAFFGGNFVISLKVGFFVV